MLRGNPLNCLKFRAETGPSESLDLEYLGPFNRFSMTMPHLLDM